MSQQPARRRRRAALALLATAATLFGTTNSASAAQQQTSSTINFNAATLSGVTNLFDAGPGYTTCDACVDDVTGLFGATVEQLAMISTMQANILSIKWDGSADIETVYEDSLLRQGETVNFGHGYTNVAAKVTVAVEGLAYAEIVGDRLYESVTLQETVTQDFACGIPFPGNPPLNCGGLMSVSLGSASLTGGDTFTGTKTVTVNPVIELTVNLSVDSSGHIATRILDSIGGTVFDSTGVAFNQSSLSAPLALPCSVPAGTDLRVRFQPVQNNLSMSGTISGSAGINVFGDTASGQSFGSVGTNVSGTGAATGTAPVAPLGTVLPDNRPPVANSGAVTYAGAEGQSIVFNGAGSTDNCGTPNLRWDFSDGGVGFGPVVNHVFTNDGTYSGLLTATDAAGNQDTATFTIVVSNQAPIANSGPDTSSVWGVPVAFNGSAIDPASDDQATLTYSWDFGDGSPSASGGASTSHAYAAPGTYVATLTACDGSNACSTDTRTVIISKRATTAGFLGENAATYNTPVELRASLVDSLGQPVVGRTVTIQVGAAPAQTATTNGSGQASTTFTSIDTAGSYAVSVGFAGDSLYGAASGAGSLAVSAQATTVVYTGALTGGPNKTITLSATLKDATGAPLAGRTIAFQLGTQSAAAVTDANGIAATSLKLNQKNGTYTVTTSFAPAGADVGRLAGSGDVDTFKLNAK